MRDYRKDLYSQILGIREVNVHLTHDAIARGPVPNVGCCARCTIIRRNAGGVTWTPASCRQFWTPTRTAAVAPNTVPARPSVRLETFQYEGCNLSGNRTQSGNSFTEARTTEHPFVLNLAVEHKGTGLGLATAHKWRRIERR
jgi:hypothetical protein